MKVKLENLTKIFPNKRDSGEVIAVNDFTFEIDGEQHMFSELDLDSLFNVKTTEDGLTIDLSKNIYVLLSELYNVDKECVYISGDVERCDVVELTFYSADGRNAIKISGLFGGLDKVFQVPSDVFIEPSEVIF